MICEYEVIMQVILVYDVEWVYSVMCDYVNLFGDNFLDFLVVFE